MKRTFHKVLHTLGAQAVGTGSGIALGIIIARVLGPSGRGVTSYAMLALGFVALYADGPATAVVVQYATDKVERVAVYHAMLRALAWLVIPATAAFALVACLLPGQRPLIAVACALPFAVYGQCVKGFFLAEGRIATANTVDIVASVGFAVVGSAVVLLGGGVIGALAAWVVTYGAQAVYGAFQLGRAPQLPGTTSDRSPRALVREQLVFGAKSGLVYGVGYLNLRMGAFVVAAMLGAAALGIYMICVSLAELMWKISNSVAWSAFGRIAGEEDEQVRHLVARLTRTIVLVEMAAAAALLVVGPWLVVRVYGPAFAPAALPLRIMTLGVATYAVEPIFGYLLLARSKRPMLVLLIQGMSAAVCAVLGVLTIPHFGLPAAAAATAVSYAGVVVVKGIIVARSLKIPIPELIVPQPADVQRLGEEAGRLFRRPRTPNEAAA